MPNELLPQLNDEPTLVGTMGIKMPSLISEFNISKGYVDQYTKDFSELDNLVDAVPINKEPGTPFIGDTTLAGLVRSIPRTSLKQLPVMTTTINGRKNSVTSIICNYLLKTTAFNEDTFGKGLLSTLQLGAEQALTHGFAPFMVATGVMYADFGTTMRLLHFSDIGLEPGISDANESGYGFIVAHLTKGRVEKILKKAENNPDTDWNVGALKELLKTDPTTDEYSIYQSDPRAVGSTEGAAPTYKFVTRYETGEDGKIITFSPEYEEAPLRVMESRSKRGYPRLLLLVIDPAPLSPFGVSRVRLSSPNQNFLNIYLGNISSTLILNSDPPMLKKGRFLKSTPLKRKAIWETTDPNASIELKTMDNGALQTFVEMSKQFSGQIQNIMGGQVGGSQAGSQTNTFGKTAPGIKAGQSVLDVETNQITKILENFLRQYGLSALDILLSEQTGDARIIVDDETKNAINQIAPETVGEDNEIELNWEEFYDSIKQVSVEVDVSLSPDEIKDEKRADLQDTMVVLAQNADRLPGAAEKVGEITNMIMEDQAPLLKPMDTTPAMPGGMPPEQGTPTQPMQ